jgi:ankyrin repeat protein
MLASASGYSDVVQLLLESRANIDAKDKACISFLPPYFCKSSQNLNLVNVRRSQLCV